MSEAKLPDDTAGDVQKRKRIAPKYTQEVFDQGPPWPAYGPSVTGVDTFITAPDGVNLVVVRIQTSDDGLIGYGCATFTQRAFGVELVINEYLKPQLMGRSVHDISDIWNSLKLGSYWRGGPLLHSALSGIDQALWDIKGKLAGLPVWQLLGGQVRRRLETYVHTSGRDVLELRDQVDTAISAGYKYIRCQVTVPGTSTYGAALIDRKDSTWDSDKYVAMIPKIFQTLTEEYGPEVRFLHDIHERLHPHEVLRLLKALEPYDLFFAEDPLSPEDLGWLERLRAQTHVPIAFGELIHEVRDYEYIVSNRLVDFIRCHISVLGGLTPALQLDALANVFGVRTAWHGPRDVSPIGHAVNAALGVISPAFGIHEHFEFSEETRDIFPGTLSTKDGAVEVGDLPGFGVSFDEKAAKKAKPVSSQTNWHYSRVRRTDGALQRP